MTAEYPRRSGGFPSTRLWWVGHIALRLHRRHRGGPGVSRRRRHCDRLPLYIAGLRDGSSTVASRPADRRDGVRASARAGRRRRILMGYGTGTAARREASTFLLPGCGLSSRRHRAPATACHDGPTAAGADHLINLGCGDSPTQRAGGSHESTEGTHGRQHRGPRTNEGPSGPRLGECRCAGEVGVLPIGYRQIGISEISDRPHGRARPSSSTAPTSSVTRPGALRDPHCSASHFRTP